MKKHWKIRYQGRFLRAIYAMTAREAKARALRTLRTDGWRIDPALLDVR